MRSIIGAYVSRGLFYLLVGQFVFLSAGYLIHIGLARHLGPDDYGLFGVVMSILVWIELFVITGIPSALQKFVGQNPASAYELRRVTLRWQILYVSTVGIATAALAPWLGELFDDIRLGALLRLASVDIVFYGLYWYYLGLQNGLHNFSKQALIVAFYSLSKLVAVYALVMIGLSVRGAVIGNILGSIAGLSIGLRLTSLDKKEAVIDLQGLRRFVVPNIAYTVVLNSLLSMDLWFVKGFLDDRTVGHYAAATVLARIPYFFSLALSAVLLPTLSRVLYRGDHQEVVAYVRGTFRYLLMVLAPVTIIVMSSGVSVVRLVYSDTYADAGQFLGVLVLGLSLITLFSVANTMLIARGGMGRCLLLAGVLVPVDVVLTLYLVPAFGALGAAWAVVVTGLVGTVLSLTRIASEFRVRLDLTSVLRIGVASVAIYIVSTAVPVSGVFLVIKLFALCLGYLTMLMLLGELTFAEMVRFGESLFTVRSLTPVAPSLEE